MGRILKKSIDIAVIGGGPGGLGAAIRAKEEGVKSVILIERSEELGGMLPQCIHNGFGLHYFKEELSGPAYIYKLRKKAEKTGVEFMTHSMVVELKKDKVVTLTKNSVMELTPKATILSMGCRERSRGALRIPGSRPAGIFTAGTAQRMLNIEGIIPGKKVVILGSGDIGMIMARRFTLEGAKIVCMAEVLPFIGGLIRNETQCLRDFNIPVYTKHTVSFIKGKKRIDGVVLSEVDQKLKPIPGTEKSFDCDTLLLSVGLIPENELSRMAGVELNPMTNGPYVDNLWQTNINGIFAGGNVVHVHDLADYVTESCEAAASSAVRFIQGQLTIEDNIVVKAGKNIRYVVPNKIKSLDPVSFYMRVTWPLKSAEINIGKLFSKKYPFVRPSEQIRIDLPVELIREAVGEIVVSCEGEEAVPR
jgi:NADPH-dependent 2,4-dienoyl-CoA reductase/sulfur reductase-like enzyme